MKRKSFFLPLALALVAAFSGLLASHARADVTFSYFYDNLSPYGEWLQVGDDYCWHPTQVDPAWRPYTDGYWTYTDAGWTWLSYEDFGAITYHYGRWAQLEDVGWVWKPGYEWGPAWVSWRTGGDYIGWAPLPWGARWHHDVGISIWADRDYDIGPGQYSFCAFGNFGAPVMGVVILPRERNTVIINQTTNITNITVVNGGRVFNGGPDFAVVSARSTRPIQTLKLQRVTDVVPGKPGMARVVGNQLVVPAPVISQSTKHPIAPPSGARVIAKPKVDTGWAGVSDPAVKQQMRAKFAEETKGVPANAPAKAVNLKQVQAVLPAKADPHGIPGSVNRQGAAVAPSAPKVERPPAEQPGKVERPAQAERPAPAEQPGKVERPAQAERPAPAEQPGKVERPAQAERPTPAERPAKVARPTPAERPAKAERPVQPERPQVERPARVPQERPTPAREAVEPQRPARVPERPAPVQREEARPERSAAPQSGGSRASQPDKTDKKKNPFDQQ